MAAGPPSWDDAVARLEDLEHRCVRRVRADLTRSAFAVQNRADGHPLEVRRITGIAVRDALAAYILAGGTPDHLARVATVSGAIGHPDDVTGSLRHRGQLARDRVGYALQHIHAGPGPAIDHDRDCPALGADDVAQRADVNVERFADYLDEQRADVNVDYPVDERRTPVATDHLVVNLVEHPDADGDVGT